MSGSFCISFTRRCCRRPSSPFSALYFSCSSVSAASTSRAPTNSSTLSMNFTVTTPGALAACAARRSRGWDSREFSRYRDQTRYDAGAHHRGRRRAGSQQKDNRLLAQEQVYARAFGGAVLPERFQVPPKQLVASLSVILPSVLDHRPGSAVDGERVRSATLRAPASPVGVPPALHMADNPFGESLSAGARACHTRPDVDRLRACRASPICDGITPPPPVCAHLVYLRRLPRTASRTERRCCRRPSTPPTSRRTPRPPSCRL